MCLDLGFIWNPWSTLPSCMTDGEHGRHYHGVVARCWSQAQEAVQGTTQRSQQKAVDRLDGADDAEAEEQTQQTAARS